MRASDPAIVEKTRAALMALGSTRGPILVGPWLSEVGFELLYWIPFLRWAVRFAGLHPEDLWIVSRGGCRSWYADLSPHYVDVLEFYSPEGYRAGNTRRIAEQASRYQELSLRHSRHSTKQHAITAFDQDIMAHVATRTGVPMTRVLHPSMMYRVFRPFWRRRLPHLYTEMTLPARLTATGIDGLPASYVAAKFYASAACDTSPIHTRMVNQIVRAVADSTPVVLLHSGMKYDDHGEFTIESHPNVSRVRLDPATNLDRQTAVIAGAQSFIGTYGGFAYLAPFVGVKAKTFYARPNFRRDHRQVIDQVCATTLRTSFTVEPIGSGASRIAARGRVRHAA